jgi:hypothetical protein
MVNNFSAGLTLQHAFNFTEDDVIFAVARENISGKLRIFLVFEREDKIYRRNGLRNRWDLIDSGSLSTIREYVNKGISMGLKVFKIPGNSRQYAGLL